MISGHGSSPYSVRTLLVRGFKMVIPLTSPIPMFTLLVWRDDTLELVQDIQETRSERNGHFTRINVPDGGLQYRFSFTRLWIFRVLCPERMSFRSSQPTLIVKVTSVWDRLVVLPFRIRFIGTDPGVKGREKKSKEKKETGQRENM